jgi:hypothetical protein
MHLCVPCLPNLIKMGGQCICGILCLIYYTSRTRLSVKRTVCRKYSEITTVKNVLNFQLSSCLDSKRKVK